jgi:hypothetical protein
LTPFAFAARRQAGTLAFRVWRFVARSGCADCPDNLAAGRAGKPDLRGMRPLVRRRIANASLTLALLAFVWLWSVRLENRLRPTSFFTGWLLLATIVFLAALQLRKRLPAPSFGSAAAWVQAHIYTGLGSAGLFLIHTPLRWPDGWLEGALAALYWVTFVSGLVGLYWTRSVPRRLARLGDEVVFERIPALRAGVRDRAQAAVLGVVRAAGATTLGEFYNARLQDYFSRKRSWRYRLAPTSGLRKSLMAELTETTRYLSDDERKTAEELFALVRQRDDLDYHDALQWRLKAWLYIHIALTYPLLMTAAVHGWLAHLFDGGTP